MRTDRDQVVAALQASGGDPGALLGALLVRIGDELAGTAATIRDAEVLEAAERRARFTASDGRFLHLRLALRTLDAVRAA